MKITEQFLYEIQDACQNLVVDDTELKAAKADSYPPGSEYGPSNHYEFLYEFVRRTRPKVVLELGTYWGLSALFMAKGSPETKIYTIDNNLCKTPNIGKYLKGTLNVEFIPGDIANKGIVDSLPNQVDFIFADGEKDPSSLQQEFDLYYPKLKVGGCMVIDDILSVWYPEAKTWWNNLQGYNKVDLIFTHVGFEMGAIIKES